MATRPPLETSEYQRNLVMLVLDRSGSMASSHVEERWAGDRIERISTTRMRALAEAVKVFLLDADKGLPSTKIGATAEVAIGCFSGQTLEWEHLGSRRGERFTLLSEIATAPPLQVDARAQTPMATAIKDAVAMMNQRIDEIARDPYLSLQYRPTMFLLTDGEPYPSGQDIEGAKRVLHSAAFPPAGRPEFFCYSLGINDANDELMSEITPEAYYPLKGHSLSTVMKFVTITANQQGGYAATQKALADQMAGIPTIGGA